MEPHNNYENDIKYSVEFIYPPDSGSAETTTQQRSDALDLLTKIANYVLPSEKPRLLLVAMFFTFGIDLSYVLDCENTETALAKRLGVAKQTLHNYVVKVRQDYGITHTTTIRHGVSGKTYKNNSKKIKKKG